MNILVINGANLNMLSKRNSDIYGNLSYEELCKRIEDYAENLDISVEIMQTNHEGDIIDIINEADENFDACIINAGAYTHYSYAIRDAIECSDIPFVEVHLSDIFSREDFRKISVIKDVCKKQFYGKFEKSYYEAIDYLAKGFEKDARKIY